MRDIQAFGGEMRQMKRVGRPMRMLEDNIKMDLADVCTVVTSLRTGVRIGLQ